MNIFVTPATSRWDDGTAPTEAGVNKLGHVGCNMIFKMAATDPNNHTVIIEVDTDTPSLPLGAEMVTIKSGITTDRAEFHWTQ